jgi:hypothetical protein
MLSLPFLNSQLRQLALFLKFLTQINLRRLAFGVAEPKTDTFAVFLTAKRRRRCTSSGSKTGRSNSGSVTG